MTDINVNFDLNPQETQTLLEAMRVEGFNPDPAIASFYVKRLLKMHTRQVIVQQLEQLNSNTSDNADLYKLIDKWYQLVV